MKSDTPSFEKFPTFLSEKYLAKLIEIDQKCRKQGFPDGKEYIDKIIAENNFTNWDELTLYFRSKDKLDEDDKLEELDVFLVLPFKDSISFLSISAFS